MRHVVIGLGEVGEPLRDILDATGWDIKDGGEPPVEPGCVLHVVFPYGPNFVWRVKEIKSRVGPGLTIVHSTVPIGTTALIPDAVHSPVQGRRGSMFDDLLCIPKWIGGPRAQEAADILVDYGFDPIVYPRSEQTEALKLLCLAQYGVDNAFARYREKVGRTVGLNDDDFQTWAGVYNEHLPAYLNRPMITPDGPKIGGHCVVPGVKHLHRDHPHPLTIAVMECQ